MADLVTGTALFHASVASQPKEYGISKATLERKAKRDGYDRLRPGNEISLWWAFRFFRVPRLT